MEENNNPNETDEIKKLLTENLSLTKEVLEVTKKVKRFMLWQQIFGILKIAIIVVPIVLGIMYLPAILKEFYASYQELLNLKPGVDLKALEGLDLNAIQKMIPGSR